MFYRNDNSINLSGLDLDKLKTHNVVFVTSAEDHVLERVPACDGRILAPKCTRSIYSQNTMQTPCWFIYNYISIYMQNGTFGCFILPHSTTHLLNVTVRYFKSQACHLTDLFWPETD